ncbi:serine/threonine protein kinase, partial [Streptomyces sp. NPDC006261]
ASIRRPRAERTARTYVSGRGRTRRSARRTASAPRGTTGSGKRPSAANGRPGTRSGARTTSAGRRPANPRLLRQRLVVFVVVTLLVALGIAAAQGCQGPARGLGGSEQPGQVSQVRAPERGQEQAGSR